MTPTVGAAAVGRFLAIIVESDRDMGAWMMIGPNVSTGGELEALRLRRMFMSLEDWVSRCAPGRSMRVAFCAPSDQEPRDGVVQTPLSHTTMYSFGRLLEAMAVPRAPEHRQRMVGEEIVRRALRDLGDEAPAEAVRALDVALTCFAVARATEPLGSC